MDVWQEDAATIADAIIIFQIVTHFILFFLDSLDICFGTADKTLVLPMHVFDLIHVHFLVLVVEDLLRSPSRRHIDGHCLATDIPVLVLFHDFLYFFAELALADSHYLV